MQHLHDLNHAEFWNILEIEESEEIVETVVEEISLKKAVTHESEDFFLNLALFKMLSDLLNNLLHSLSSVREFISNSDFQEF